MKEKICSTCRQLKTLVQFYKNCNSTDGRLARCKACDNEIRLHRYRHNYKTRATAVWHALQQRIGDADGKNPSYRSVTLALTQSQFIAWYIAALPSFFVKFGQDATPSVDRIRNSEGYALDNIQMIPMPDNSRKRAGNRNVHAPEGQAWCTACRAYLPRDSFYKNKAQHHGLAHRCKQHFNR